MKLGLSCQQLSKMATACNICQSWQQLVTAVFRMVIIFIKSCEGHAYHFHIKDSKGTLYDYCIKKMEKAIVFVH